jgi:cell division protein FtsI/penicillin-binding protein 2
VLAILLPACVGAAVIASHALRLADAGDTDVGDSGIAAYREAVPGAVIDVPAQAGAHVQAVAGGAILALNGMRGHDPVRIDLCGQLRADGRLQPLRLGPRWDELAARGKPARHALLAAGEVPAVQVDGRVDRRDALRLSWRGRQAAWVADGGAVDRLVDRQVEGWGRGGDGGVGANVSAGAGAGAVTGKVTGAGTVAGAGAGITRGTGNDAGEGELRQHGWLVWAGGALRFERRAAVSCPQAGELVVQLYRPAEAPAGRCCTVMAFPRHGAMVAGVLPPGRHAVPAALGASRPAREDRALFDALLAQGLLRLEPDGLLSVAPRDLAAWAGAAPQDRAAPLAGWDGAARGADAMRVLKRLYRQADGAYVLRQIEVYNSERRLLAWRTPLADAGGADASVADPVSATGGWQVRADGAPLAGTGAMPGAAARLFAELPQGWAPWRRAPEWPQGAALSLVHPGSGAALRLMVAGRIDAVRGARIQARVDACTGNGCATPADVTDLRLEPDGAGPVTVHVRPLSSAVAAGDVRYRHIHVERGVPVWRALGGAGVAGVADAARHIGLDPQPLPQPPGQSAREVRIADRNGALLWSDGGAVREAQAAGLSAMLGVAPEHASGIAGMLARVPDGGPQSAVLTLDLPLQRRAQAIVECIALRRGRWDGAACGGGGAPPAGRQAGLVLLDAHSGAILAAAGAGNAPAGAFNWAEVRDFDRANPARSPLRIPAWQHDGGIHRSPGSTFKVVSALGLELAARGDRQLDALLDGMAPADINRMARARGYGFGTAAPSYPAGARAHITNYREQGLEHRAQDGKLGLRQALAYSQNTWFAWTAEWSDRGLLGLPEGGMPDVQPLEPGALDPVRPVAAAARRLGFGAAMRLDGGLLPPGYRWSAYDALQATPSRIDPIETRHEVRQMAIGLRMQATPLQMALVSGAVGEGASVAPRVLQALNGRAAMPAPPLALPVRLDRIRSGMKGVIDSGTAAGAFGGPALAAVRRGLYGKTGTAPTGEGAATVWFTGWLEPGTLPGQAHRLAFAVFVSHSEASGGEHAAPVIAALLGDGVARERIAGIAGKEGEIAVYPLK